MRRQNREVSQDANGSGSSVRGRAKGRSEVCRGSAVSGQERGNLLISCHRQPTFLREYSGKRLQLADPDSPERPQIVFASGLERYAAYLDKSREPGASLNIAVGKNGQKQAESKVSPSGPQRENFPSTGSYFSAGIKGYLLM